MFDVVVDATAPRRPWRANAMTSELQLDMMMMVRWKELPRTIAGMVDHGQIVKESVLLLLYSVYLDNG